jgi:hypothetical protein
MTHIIRPANKNVANDAVNMLLVVNTTACDAFNCLSRTKLNKIAANDANRPTTIA